MQPGCHNSFVYLWREIHVHIKREKSEGEMVRNMCYIYQSLKFTVILKAKGKQKSGIADIIVECIALS